uniref:uncharacterized protein n=1 Tax=Pristiophorus japonicus TaxID=55135 RepID=UPI00398E5F9C
MHCLLLQSLVLSNFIQFITGEVYSTPGSSVSFPGVTENQRVLVKVFLWEVSSGNVKNGSRMGVLQFHAGAEKPSLMNKYKGRLDFFPFNGSFALHNLTYGDEGRYTLSINLPKTIARTVQLRVIDALSKPSILSNSSSLGSTIQIICDVFGNPHEYQWQKDGGEISQHHWLINGNRSLIIPSATKGDCGTYTCVAINPVSSSQADYTLTIYGIPGEQIVIVVTAIIGLILSAVSLFGLIVLCYLKGESSQVSLRQPKRLFLSLFISNTLSLVANFIALTSWIAIKGNSPASVVALCFVSVLLVLAGSVTIVIWNMGCLCIWKFLANIGFRALIDFCGIMCSIIVMTVSIIILAEEIQLNNQGCQFTILTWSILIPLLAVCAVIFAVSFAIWRCKTEDNNGDAANQHQDGRELQALNGIKPEQEL